MANPQSWMYPYPSRKRATVPSTTLQRQDRKQREDELIPTKKANGWKDLPDDVLLSIFGRLETEDLIVGAPLCCKSWYRVSQNPILWRHVNLYDFGLYGYYRKKPVLPTQLIHFAMARCQGFLVSIKVPLAASYEDLLYIVERCPELEEMELLVSVISGISVLKPIIQSLPSFRKLILHGYFLEDTARKIPALFPRVRVLDLYDCPLFSETDLVDIHTACSQLETLRKPKVRTNFGV